MGDERKIRPITPRDVLGEKLDQIPEFVIGVFNELIAKNFSGGSSTVLQSEVVKLLEEKGHTRAEIFDNHWLDVEEIYKGWNVNYDKPGFNESYAASFTFTPRKKE